MGVDNMPSPVLEGRRQQPSPPTMPETDDGGNQFRATADDVLNMSLKMGETIKAQVEKITPKRFPPQPASTSNSYFTKLWCDKDSNNLSPNMIESTCTRACGNSTNTASACNSPNATGSTKPVLSTPGASIPTPSFMGSKAIRKRQQQMMQALSLGDRFFDDACPSQEGEEFSDPAYSASVSDDVTEKEGGIPKNRSSKDDQVPSARGESGRQGKKMISVAHVEPGQDNVETEMKVVSDAVLKSDEPVETSDQREIEVVCSSSDGSQFELAKAVAAANVCVIQSIAPKAVVQATSASTQGADVEVTELCDTNTASVHEHADEPTARTVKANSESMDEQSTGQTEAEVQKAIEPTNETAKASRNLCSENGEEGEGGVETNEIVCGAGSLADPSKKVDLPVTVLSDVAVEDMKVNVDVRPPDVKEKKAELSPSEREVTGELQAAKREDMEELSPSKGEERDPPPCKSEEKEELSVAKSEEKELSVAKSEEKELSVAKSEEKELSVAKSEEKERTAVLGSIAADIDDSAFLPPTFGTSAATDNVSDDAGTPSSPSGSPSETRLYTNVDVLERIETAIKQREKEWSETTEIRLRRELREELEEQIHKEANEVLETHGKQWAQEHEEDIHDMKQKYAHNEQQTLAAMAKAHEEKEEAVRRELTFEKEELRSEMTQKADEALAAVEKVFAHKEQDLRERLLDMQVQLEQIGNEHEKQLQSVEEAHEAEKQKLRDEVAASKDRALETSMKATKELETKTAAIEGLRESYERQLKEMEETMKAEMTTVMKEAEQSAAKETRSLQAKYDELKGQYEDDMQNLRNHLKMEHKKEMKALKTKHEKDLYDSVVDHKETIANLRIQEERQVMSYDLLKQEMGTLQSYLESAHARNKEELARAQGHNDDRLRRAEKKWKERATTYEDVISSLQVEMNQAAEHAARKLEAEEERRDELSQEHQRDLEGLKEKYELRIEAKDKEKGKLQKQFEKDVLAMIREREVALSELEKEKELKHTLENLRRQDSMKRKMAEMNHAREVEVSELKQKYDLHIQKLEQEIAETHRANEDALQKRDKEFKRLIEDVQRRADSAKLELEVQISDLKSERSSQLSRDEEIMQQEKKQHKLAMDELEARLKGLHFKQVNELNTKISVLYEQLCDESTMNAQSLVEEKQRSRGMIAQIEAESSKERDDLVSAFESKERELTRQVDEIREAMDKMEKDHEGEIQKLTEEMRAKAGEMKVEHDAQLEEARKPGARELKLQEKLCESQDELAVERKRCDAKVQELRDAHKTEIDDILNQLDVVEDEQKEKIIELENKTEQKEAIISAIGTQLAETRNQMQALEGKLRNQEERLAENEVALENALNANQGLQDALEASREEKDQAVKEAFRSKEEILEEERQRGTKEMEKVKAEIIKSAESQFDEANKQFLKLESDHEAAKTKIAHLENEVQARDDELTTVKMTFQARENETTTELAKLKTKVATADATAARKATEFSQKLELQQAKEREAKSKITEVIVSRDAALLKLAQAEKEKEAVVKEKDELVEINEELMALAEQQAGVRKSVP